MIEYALRRIALGVVTIVVVTVLVFLVVRILPGDAVALMLQNSAGVTAGEAQQLRAQFGLNQPVWIQLWEWLQNAVRGDLGESFYSGESVAQMFAARIPVTLQLVGMTFVFGTSVGLALGILSAAKHGSKTDTGMRAFVVAGLSIPNFVLAVLLITFLALAISWSPPVVYQGPTEDFWGWFQQMGLPALALSMASLAGITRITRSTLLEALDSNSIRTVRAKGVPERVVLLKHAMRRASIPIFTLTGQAIATVLGGTVILESLLSIQGTGQLIYHSVLQRDYPVVVACTIFYATTYIFVILIVDLTYALLDPRIRYGRR